MRREIVIVSALALAGRVGMYFSSIQKKAIETSPQVGNDHQGSMEEDQITVSRPDSQDSIDEETMTESEKKKYLLHRSAQLSSKLDSSTKDLDSELENSEKRKSI